MPYIGKQPANVPVTADDIPNDSITAAKIVGELHIIGFPINYTGKIRVEREGYFNANLEIESGLKKAYLMADLSRSKSGPKIEKNKMKELIDKEISVKKKKKSKFEETINQLKNQCSNIVSVLTFGKLILF